MPPADLPRALTCKKRIVLFFLSEGGERPVAASEHRVAREGEYFFAIVAVLVGEMRWTAAHRTGEYRIAHDGNLWVCENLISYDGGPWMLTVSILLFRDDRVEHERIYITDGWEAAPWRAEWAERFDPLEALTTDDWRASAATTG